MNVLAKKQIDSKEGVDISEAAKILGISVEATRKRLQRGSLQGYKVDDRWYIVLDVQDMKSRTRPEEDSDTSGTESENDQDTNEDVQGDILAYQQMVESLQGEISFLRQELSARTEENRRKDHIIAGLTQRIPELPSADQQEPGESLKHELMNQVQSEIAATVQRLEERDRKLMEVLREIQDSKDQQKKGWWPWRRA